MALWSASSRVSGKPYRRLGPNSSCSPAAVTTRRRTGSAGSRHDIRHSGSPTTAAPFLLCCGNPTDLINRRGSTASPRTSPPPGDHRHAGPARAAQRGRQRPSFDWLLVSWSLPQDGGAAYPVPRNRPNHLHRAGAAVRRRLPAHPARRCGGRICGGIRHLGAGAARAMYKPLLAQLRDTGCMGLLMSGNPHEGQLIGACRPTPLPAGRGMLITRRAGAQLVGARRPLDAGIGSLATAAASRLVTSASSELAEGAARPAADQGRGHVGVLNGSSAATTSARALLEARAQFRSRRAP